MRSQRLVTCTRCNGAGNYYQKRTVVRCPECNGRGEYTEEFESHAHEQAGGNCGLVLLGLVLSLTGLLGGLVRLVA